LILKTRPNANNRPAFFNDRGGVFRCPAAVNWGVREGGGSISNTDYGYNSYGLTWIGPRGAKDDDSFGLGGHVVDFNIEKTNSNSSAPPIYPSEILDPSDMLAIGDGFSGSKGVFLDISSFLSRNRDWSGSPDQPYLNFAQITKSIYARHQGRANMVFCDGHVATFTFKFLFQDTNDVALACWNRDHLPHRDKLSP
jgi:prepilin-type processing-associated H-X9-DG protein